MLKLNNIQVIYSNVILVLKGLSLEVPDGKIVALLGANGAGKTTTLKAISGLLKTEDGRVTDGDIEFKGQQIHGRDPEDICRLGIVQVMEGRKVLESLTIEENLRIGAYTRRDADGAKSDLEMIYQYFPRLVERRHQLAGYLSGGEQQMLVIGRALMAKPTLMLLDEPSLGLAPLLVRGDLRDHPEDQRGAGDDVPAGGAERPHRARDRRLRLHHGERPDRLRRSGRQAPGQRRRARVLPRPERSGRAARASRTSSSTSGASAGRSDRARPVSRCPARVQGSHDSARLPRRGEWQVQLHAVMHHLRRDAVRARRVPGGPGRSLPSSSTCATDWTWPCR